ncbi:MAG: uroporphyrinogen-III C-methyltransferase [Acidobacteria bacterium]|nr:MAG: uroporphyrinogen-III C-methyltransferase [Acidobacteriota bacterium]
MAEPFVSLIGAGPGDPELLTLKGARRLREANVIVYDRLAAPELLAHAHPDAELINAGKEPGNPGLGQDEINRLIVQKALEGKRVARLKGGDPFVFGRGGEEALACAEAGVAFEVIPGITSGIAAPAYAGIPVTHRGISTSVTLVTGHEDFESSGVDWESLGRLGGTLVLMMSVGSLPEICSALVGAGRDPKTPVAAIEWGTRPEQRVVMATLENLPREASRFKLKAPAAVVVGEVTALREQIAWVERLPLWGKRVLVTRAREQASALAVLLEDLGADVVTFPLISIEEASSPESLTDALERLGGGGFSWVLFASTNGVERTRTAMAALAMDSRAFAGVKVGAIGPATADALERSGITPDITASVSTSEGLLAELPESGRGEVVLLIRAEEGRRVLPDGLRERGFDVEEVAAYRTVFAESDTSAIRAQIEVGEIDAVTFASSSTVLNYVDLMGDKCVPGVVACIGPATAATARDLGIEPTVVAQSHTIEGLVDALRSAFGNV